MNGDMICKAMHTENDEMYCIVKNENMVKFAVVDEDMEDESLKMPRVMIDVYLDDETRVKGKYKHFKGNEYEVLGIAYDLKGEKYVFYKALYERDIKFFIRPYDMFFEPVDKEKYPDVNQEMRFAKM